MRCGTAFGFPVLPDVNKKIRVSSPEKDGALRISSAAGWLSDSIISGIKSHAAGTSC
jgi:hypothetical protein